MVETREVGPDRLAEYARIPITFEVRMVCRVESLDLGFRLVEEPVMAPYTKDYHARDDPDGRVLNWPKHFAVSKWRFFIADEGGEDVGAATVAVHTPAVHMLEERSDLAVLWDIRVRPDKRRQGVGTALFRYPTDWAQSKGCRQMKVETQNTNVPASRFYAGQGVRIGRHQPVRLLACPAAAHETMLLWYPDLGLEAAGAQSRPTQPEVPQPEVPHA